MPEQALLFDITAMNRRMPAIAGLRYIPNAISVEREAELIQSIDAQPWMTDLKRRVQHYGYRYDYKAKDLAENLYLGPMPEWLQFHCERLQKNGHFQRIPDQVIVNEYMPGQGIAPHIDCIPCFGETIASVSLGSACLMDFLRDDVKASLYLEPRSLLVLTGEARYRWKHAIAARKSDRVGSDVLPRARRLSLTFRNVIQHRSHQ